MTNRDTSIIKREDPRVTDASVLADGIGLRGYACAPCTRLGFASEYPAGRCDDVLRGDSWSLRVCILVAAMLGGLVFSAGTVYEYACKAFRGRKAKAASFVVLVEVLMTFSPLWWLSVAALVILAAINGIQTARTMA